MSNEVSFLGSLLYSALSSLDHFQQICLDHFLSHYGGGLQVLGMFVTVRTLSLLILEV